MKGCLGVVMMLLLLAAAAVTLGFNFLVNQSLDFEEKSDSTGAINTRRSFRPVESSDSASSTTQDIQAVPLD